MDTDTQEILKGRSMDPKENMSFLKDQQLPGPYKSIVPAKQSKINLHFPPNTKVVIVGQNKLHNELLLSYIKDHLGIFGMCVKNLGVIKLTSKSEPIQPDFILLDCNNIEIDNLWTEIYAWKLENSGIHYMAFCNVTPEMGIEKIALNNDIHGIFYENESIEMIPKGISAILGGDIWYPRKILLKCFLDLKVANTVSENGVAVELTSREKEILSFITAGYSNKKIADNLCISFHTVKTHAYNIYKKLGVENRYQALLWAAKYL